VDAVVESVVGPWACIDDRPAGVTFCRAVLSTRCKHRTAQRSGQRSGWAPVTRR
jgi:hypothetical protein